MGDFEKFLLLASAAFAVAVYGLIRLMQGMGGGKIRRRLQQDQPQAAAFSVAPEPAKPAVSDMLHKIGSAAARPFESNNAATRMTLRRRLGYAGIYSTSAVKLLVGCKVIFLLVGILVGWGLGSMIRDMFFNPMIAPMLGICFGGLIGYMLPLMWLNYSVAAHKQKLEFGLPDALDLLVICVEAGLTVDSAMQRVGREISLARPELAREMGIFAAETQVGVSRADALKNMGIRTGCEGLQSLAAMLVQAERFGTGIANALRIEADALRAKRQFAAEEMAAKTAVKLTFPVVLFIFPVVMIVLIAPAIIKMVNSPFFNT